VSVVQTRTTPWLTVLDSRVKVQGLGFRILHEGFRAWVQGLGLGNSELGLQGLVCEMQGCGGLAPRGDWRCQGLGFRVKGEGFRV